jgi:lipopolysaccharide transport system ATP-binding protein
MNDVAIRAEGLGKRYYLRKARHTSLRETLNNTVLWPKRILLGEKRDGNALTRYQPFWALRDISFDVRRGEVLGIIGRNGAGKSTLLQILSRITTPTTGHAVIRGRQGVLLQIGSGFHPLLTGRENVYMNGSILGMKRAEVDQKFDSILAFSEIGEFVDTPVKFYSRGMYVRLAFSVASHLDAEILIIDEVLAVGDLAFRQKSREKLISLAAEGRSVVIVSHMVDIIKQFCTRMMLLEDGQIAMIGEPYNIVEEYKKLLFGDDIPENLRRKKTPKRLEKPARPREQERPRQPGEPGQRRKQRQPGQAREPGQPRKRKHPGQSGEPGQRRKQRQPKQRGEPGQSAT